LIISKKKNVIIVRAKYRKYSLLWGGSSQIAYQRKINLVVRKFKSSHSKSSVHRIVTAQTVVITDVV